MTSLPEQFQAARQFQLDQQFSFLRNLGDQALDRTSRLVALNLDLSRAAVEHSSSTVRQLMAVRDPRDLLTIGAQSQRQLRTMFDYGHELFNIATGLRGAALRTWSVAAAPAPALAAPVNVVESAVATVQEAVQETVNQTASATEQVAKQISEPAPVSVSAADTAPDTSSIVTSSIVPPVEPTPIAKATSEILDVPLAPHPVAASVPVDVDVEIELPKVEPVDATPPVAPPSNGAPKVTEIRSGRGRRKGN
jgi:Phasin protein